MVRLKLLIDKPSNKVLYAEADKDFVDFLFSLLRLPLGCVMKLINSNGMVGSIGKIYSSVKNFGSSYMLPDQSSLLMPSTPTMPLLNPTSTYSSSYGRGKEVDGHVKDGVTYMVTDDLEVTPISTISIFTLMNRFNVKDVGDLEEKVVNVEQTKGLALLNASMGSKTVLTDVFLRG